MLKCPYCFEVLEEKNLRCPHCAQYILDEPVTAEFAGVDTKPCLFCGKPILAEARVCRHCRRWLDEIDRLVDSIDPDDVF